MRMRLRIFRYFSAVANALQRAIAQPVDPSRQPPRKMAFLNH